MPVASCFGSPCGRWFMHGRLQFVIAVAIGVLLPAVASADWLDEFSGGAPSQTWIWQQLNGAGSPSGASPTYGPGSVSVSNSTPVAEGGPAAYFGLVPQPFQGRQVVTSSLISSGSLTMPIRNAGVLGLINSTTLDAYAATLDYTDGGLDVSKISLASPTTLLPARTVRNFDPAASYGIQLEQYGQSITGRVYDAAGILVTSVSAVDPLPYTAGLAGLGVNRSDDAVIRSRWGTTAASTPANVQFWSANGVILGGAGTLSGFSTTFLTNGSGAATAWNPAQAAVFTADSEYFQNSDPAAPNFYEAYRVPTPVYVASVPASGVPVSNAIKFYANQYSIRWVDDNDPTFMNFTSGKGLILSGTVDFDVAPEVIGTISARLTGSGGFRKTGPGTLNLVNMFSDFTGAVTIDEGTVYLGSNGYENMGVTNNLGAANAARRVVVNGGGVLSFRSIECMTEGNSKSPTAAVSTQTLVANDGGLITNNIMLEQAGEDNPLDNWHYNGAYSALGNVELNSGEMLGQATFWNDLWTKQVPEAVTRDTYPGFQAFMLQGSVTSTGNSRIAMRASTEFLNEWNRVSGNGTGGDGLYTYNDSTGFHLNWSGGTTFNVTSGTLTVSANLLDSPAGDSSETPSGTRDSIRAGLTKTGAGTMVLSGSNWMTGSVDVSQGVLRAENPGGNQPLQFTPVAVSAGEVQLGGSPSEGPATPSLNVASLAVNGGRARLTNGFSSGTTAPSGPLVVTTGSLSVAAGAQLDLGNGTVVAGGISAVDLVADIVAGRGDGSWNGTSGITSSVAAESGGSRAVGWMDLGGGTMQVAYSAPGDTNLDFVVDILDVSNFISAGKYGTTDAATWMEGDFNYDGFVDIQDLADFSATGLYDAGNYNAPGEGLDVLGPSGAMGIAAVPEPSSCLMAVAGLVGCGVAAMRRRRA
ncbi:MAG: PEP-CTERM sorting domain-containing protein [Planctomycetes bacterium]|nr:PEP-CTERM sorting domain-containing protein [Planctomycetota bacterium]